MNHDEVEKIQPVVGGKEGDREEAIRLIVQKIITPLLKSSISS
jgi:hypothetical protein